MRADMNPIRNYQYTMWESWEAHEEFHRRMFPQFFELCTLCLDIVVEGPWEPVFEVVSARMPPVRSMSQITELAQDLNQQKEFVRFVQSPRCVVLAEHTALPGKEQELERGLTAVMEALAEHAPGFQGYMVLRQEGVNPWGSFMLDPQSTMEARMTLGAVPPQDPRPQFRTPQAKPHPTEYLLHTEWESSDHARMGFGKSAVNRKIREIHDGQVMAHLLRGPYYLFFQPMMEEETWRSLV
jgi:sulfur oxygenase/reductase